MSEGNSDALLVVSGLGVRYGVITAVANVDLSVRRGEVVAIVGPNGAGKTSLLSAIIGMVAACSGSVTFDGKPLGRVSLEDMAMAGIALVPEGRQIFASLSVLENLMLGATPRKDTGGIREDIERFFQTFPILGRRRHQPAGQLSGGEQQQLAIVRGLLSRPKLLMLDEPSLGLAPSIVDQVYALLAPLRDSGVSLLLVEQSAERAFTLANRIHVMRGGRFALAGTPDKLRNDPNFDAAYFGVSLQPVIAAS
jgi:branched-chain amino acid transport system ATP-binding protein